MSETNNQYWNGTAHAKLAPADITASWGSGDHSLIRIDAANRAFCIYYWAKKTLIDSAGDSHWNAMYSALNDCATSGSGVGADDLQEALDHIDSNGGRWSDDETTSYFGGNGKSYKRPLIQDMPVACANFLSAVDDKLPALQTALREYQEKCQALERLRLTPESTTNWEQIKTAIDAVKNSAQAAKPLMWLVPAAVQANVPRLTTGPAAARIEAFSQAGTARISQAISFLDTIGNIHDGLTVYVDATTAFRGDRRAGLAFAALSYALTFVPILGTFYGTIVQKIPGLVTSWTEFMADYHRTRLHPELYLSRRASAPAAWRCEICNSSGGY
ncbi:MAG: hypothetical protein AB7F88_04670 [Pyrinomonadaceae bacterium]